MRRHPSNAELTLAVEAQAKVIASIEEELAGRVAVRASDGVSNLDSRKTKLLGARAKLHALEAQRDLEHAVEKLRADARIVNVSWRTHWRMLRTHQVAFAAMSFEFRSLRVALADGSVHHVVVPREATGEDLLLAFGTALMAGDHETR